jgi:predicted lipoprotein with Yx(FWY)xxD motif
VRSSKKFVIPTIAVAVSVLLSACGSSSSSSSSSSASAPQSSSAPATAAVVKTATDASLGGTILVNAHGFTLYRLSGEKTGKFICTSTACLNTWHPLVATGGKPSGSVGSLGAVKRPDGTMQVTYKGEPLYTFAADHSPGQANGQGFKDVGTWSAVTTSGAKTSAPAPTQSTSSSSGGGGYAY